MSQLIEEIKDQKSWDDFLLKEGGHVVQSWEWGEFKATQDTTPTRIGVLENNSLKASAQYTLHPIPFLNKFVGYLPKGPTVKDPEKYLPIILEAIKNKAKEQNCVFVRIEPSQYSDNQLWVDILDKNNLSKSPKTIFAPYTMVLDLSQSEEELLKNMHPKWRYNIRLSQRKGIKVQEEDTDRALKEFIALQKQTAARDKFFLHPDSYYEKLFQLLHPQGLAHLLTARFEGKLAAAWLLFSFGQTLYYPYGASNYEFRSLMSSHALMWEAIKLGKKLGCEVFDLWGAAAPEADKNDPWLGFTQFKEGFGAKRVAFLGTFDLVIDQASYQLFNAADKTRWLVLKWLKKI